MEPIEGSYLHWGGSGAMEGVRSIGEGSMGPELVMGLGA